MNEHLLDVHITKNFEKLTVLKDVKFHVNKNEFLVIVGPTSCGKTTLANILSGIDTNYEGEVKLFGERVDPKRHNISYVFQEPSCIPWYTMIQRVAIARAYATAPDLLIMDEPFGRLDAQTRYLMQMEIMRIWHDDKKTVVFITNNIEEAVYVGSRVIVLSKLPATIKAEHIIDLPHPRDLTDAEFLRIRAKIAQQCEVVD